MNKYPRRRITVLAVAVGLIAMGGATLASADGGGGGHATQCFKHEGGNLNNEHGSVTNGGSAVTLNQFNQSWFGDHWESLNIKGGPDHAGVTFSHPSAGVAYFAPDNPNSGKPYSVSHWTVCKGETPTPPTTSIPVTTTTIPVTTTTPPTTVPPTTVPDTTTTPPTTTMPPTTVTTPPTLPPTSTQPPETTLPPTTSIPPTTAPPSLTTEPRWTDTINCGYFASAVQAGSESVDVTFAIDGDVSKSFTLAPEQMKFNEWSFVEDTGTKTVTITVGAETESWTIQTNCVPDLVVITTPPLAPAERTPAPASPVVVALPETR